VSSQDRTPADKCYVENPPTPPQNNLFGTNRPTAVELAEIEHPSQDAEVQIFNRQAIRCCLCDSFVDSDTVLQH